MAFGQETPSETFAQGSGNARTGPERHGSHLIWSIKLMMACPYISHPYTLHFYTYYFEVIDISFVYESWSDPYFIQWKALMWHYNWP